MDLLSLLTMGLLTAILSVLTGESALVPALYSFGDSLADVGNNNYLIKTLPGGTDQQANFPYNGIDYPGEIPTGRFSNGYITVDYIAKYLGLEMSPPPYLSLTDPSQMVQGVSFASGGSGILETTYPGTISLSTQVILFEIVTRALAEKLGPDQAAAFIAKSLFTIMTGNNDIGTYFTYHNFGITSVVSDEQFISTLVNNLTVHLTNLYKLGARKFWIAGIADIGCSPGFRSGLLNASGECIDRLNHLSVQFNIAVENSISRLSKHLEGMKYSFADRYRMSSVIKADASAFGLTELNCACCGGGKLNGQIQCNVHKHSTLCSDRSNHLFWDWYHLTQAVTKSMSEMAISGSQMFSTPVNIQQLVS